TSALLPNQRVGLSKPTLLLGRDSHAAPQRDLGRSHISALTSATASCSAADADKGVSASNIAVRLDNCPSAVYPISALPARTKLTGSESLILIRIPLLAFSSLI